jgi:hypothetical protein
MMSEISKIKTPEILTPEFLSRVSNATDLTTMTLALPSAMKLKRK